MRLADAPIFVSRPNVFRAASLCDRSCLARCHHAGMATVVPGNPDRHRWRDDHCGFLFGLERSFRTKTTGPNSRRGANADGAFVRTWPADVRQKRGIGGIVPTFA